MDQDSSSGDKKQTFMSIIPDFVYLLSLLLIIIGAVLLSLQSGIIVFEEPPVDYKDCHNRIEQRCSSVLVAPHECVCKVNMEIQKPLLGQVTVYYELKNFDQTSSDYAGSRDDKQLQGDLSGPPSPACGNYSYAETPQGRKPIMPCGEIADSIFNDTIDSIIFNTAESKKVAIKLFSTGLEGITDEDRQKYRNPPGDLKEALQNFSKPIDWRSDLWDISDATKNAWESSTNHSGHGIQNEAFIAWMKTDMKRKPVYRVEHSGEFEQGLPAGNYTIQIKTRYPFEKYDGPRLIILSSVQMYTNTALVVMGALLIVAGALVLIAKIVYNKRKHGNYLYCRVASYIK